MNAEETSGHADAHQLSACSYCGLVQRVELDDEHAWACARCDSPLRDRRSGSPALSAVCACTAVLFLALVLAAPLFEMHLMGRFSSATVLTGPRLLAQRGAPELGLLVLFTLLIAPALHLAALGLTIVGAHMRNPPRFLLMPLGILHTTRHWSMYDVFLLALLVCYVRLRDWTHVEIGQAVIALVALLLITLAGEAALDTHALWRRVPAARRAAPSARDGFIACTWCHLLNHAQEREPCARCGRTLALRKRESLTRATAYLSSAILLSFPANLLPVMDMVRFGRSEASTIFSGVSELTRHHLWGLAIVIFLASIVIPWLKIAALALMIGMTARRSPRYLKARTRAYRLVYVLGRWSLVDVFAVAILVSLVHVGVMASVLPGAGALAFGAVVILTMLATDAFDPRLMWDAGGANGAAPGRSGR